MRRVIEAALTAAGDTDGLVDATLGTEIERGRLRHALRGDRGSGWRWRCHWLRRERPRAVTRRSAGGRSWSTGGLGTVTRPPGLNLDSGGIAKGVFADELATLLAGFEAYALDCAGDVRLGGTAGLLRDVHIAEPVRPVDAAHLSAALGGGRHQRDRQAQLA